VGGIGTGGTLTGVNKRLKEFSKRIQVVGIEPKVGSKIQGLRNMQAYKPEIFAIEKLDKNILIEDDNAAFALAREIFKKEGVSVGISSGAALWGALELIRQGYQGKIVVLFPDKGDKYLSTDLFN
jgi:cysteine synthase